VIGFRSSPSARPSAAVKEKLADAVHCVLVTATVSRDSPGWSTTGVVTTMAVGATETMAAVNVPNCRVHKGRRGEVNTTQHVAEWERKAYTTTG